MKQRLLVFSGAAVLLALLWTACTKPTPFGADLLDDQIADYAYIDTFTVNFTVLREDSVLTADLSSTADYFMCGAVNDPIFGKTTADIYTLAQMDYLDPGFDTTIHRLDSIVMYLAYDTQGFYGDTTVPQTIRVQRLTEALDRSKSYYSSDALPAGEEIGRIDNFLPRPRNYDSLFVSTSKAAFLRIRLDDAFGQELLRMDSADLISDSAFYSKLRGLKISSEPSGGGMGSILGFDLNNNSYSLIRMYYTQYKTDTTHITFDYFFGGQGMNKFMHFQHDYAGTEAGQAIGQPATDFLYVQGGQGIRLKVEFPYVNQLDDIVVNDARLQLTTATVANDNALLTPCSQVIFTQFRGDTTYVFSPDVSYSLGPSLNGGFSIFGGSPVKKVINSTEITRYELALSQQLQDMVDDESNDLKNKTLYINVYPQARSMMRSIWYGPKNATYPAKLALKYTRL